MFNYIRTYGFKIGVLVIMIATPYFLMNIFKKNTTPIITIWIHGTGPNGILHNSTNQFINKQAKPFIYCKPGLHKASLLPKNYHHYKIAEQLCKEDPEQFTQQWFYLFGWSGELDHATRRKAAKDLFKELKKLIFVYKTTYHCIPKIRIIAHSHGGNVALNLAHIKNNIFNSVIIDELILLACPVQEDTKKYVNNRMFKHVYSIHSHLDMVQVLDPQGWPVYKKTIQHIFSSSSFDEALNTAKKLKDKKLFSDRHFPNNNKVIQVRYQSKHRDITHIEFILFPFIKRLPAILKQIKNYRNPQLHSTEILINR